MVGTHIFFNEQINVPNLIFFDTVHILIHLCVDAVLFYFFS